MVCLFTIVCFDSDDYADAGRFTPTDVAFFTPCGCFTAPLCGPSLREFGGDGGWSMRDGGGGAWRIVRHFSS